MTGKTIDGKAISQKIRQSLLEETKQLKKVGVTPGLAVILVGNNSASRTYVTAKRKACESLGIYSKLIELPEDISEPILLTEIDQLNHDKTIHGILVQLPLPKHIREATILSAIHPDKDVDGFHPTNAGKLLTKQDGFISCTPFGIVKMLQETGIDIAGKHVVVIGRSNIVGKPVGQLLLNENATVTYCHSRTADLTHHTLQADILIVAIGRAKFIQKHQVKSGAVVIDVGINRNEQGKLCGDVDFEEVKEKAAFITPVPGGVGPMTIAMLMYNTVKSAKEMDSV